MRSAVERDFTLDPATGRFQPVAKPGGGGHGGGNGGGGGGGGTTTVTGASWTKGGTVLTATGKVYFELDSGAYICSGTAITDGRSGASIVLTAGHCGYDGEDGGFARNWMFIPDFDGAPTYTCSRTVYGCWVASALVLNRGFTSAGGFNTQATQYDWTFAVVPDAGNPGSLESTVGSFPTSFAAMATSAAVDAFGYPAAGKYRGNDLTYCQGPWFNDSLNSSLTYGIDCGMTGGSSGGPWFTGFDTSGGNGGTIQSLNSYGYSGLSNMYGPKLNANTSATYQAALTATGNTIVP
jgi:V8-like Glu-specific endopeptidase